MKKNEVFNLSFCLVLFISCSYRQTAKKTRVIVEQPAAATHQSTSVQNLTFDLGQLNLSGGSSDANTSFSNLVLDILKTTKENSEIIKETAKRNYETNRLWFVVKDTHDLKRSWS
ncbi:unnamed protein product [Rhizophagus irregularis]|uniref:Uncharacterized protein n=1 Tax=Rhizophagus irregularis TaxID=588596 RepID=A0A915YZV6_9GLOM|nr:unnamed protein product [Rhizophagus irregularis]CAB5354682.1 unnamed protein product [Rhizophagus irregularis]